MTSDKYSEIYWAQYVSLEKEFLETMRYVSLSIDNYKTFSQAYAKLMLEIGSEVDILLKLYCKMLQPDFNKDTIKDYQKCINENKQEFGAQVVKVKNTGVNLKPWESWMDSEPVSPRWWTVYNKVKHERTNKGTIGDQTKEYYKFANLENTLSALSALYQVFIYTYYQLASDEKKRILTPLPASRLFELSGGDWDNVNFYGDMAFFINEDGHLCYQTGNIYY